MAAVHSPAACRFTRGAKLSPAPAQTAEHAIGPMKRTRAAVNFGSRPVAADASSTQCAGAEDIRLDECAQAHGHERDGILASREDSCRIGPRPRPRCETLIEGSIYREELIRNVGSVLLWYAPTLRQAVPSCTGGLCPSPSRRRPSFGSASSN